MWVFSQSIAPDGRSIINVETGARIYVHEIGGAFMLHSQYMAGESHTHGHILAEFTTFEAASAALAGLARQLKAVDIDHVMSATRRAA